MQSVLSTFGSALLVLAWSAICTASDDASPLPYLKTSREKFESFVIRGMFTYERFLPEAAKRKAEFDFEYRFLRGSQRLIMTPRGTEEPDKTVVVSTEDISFNVLQSPDGREQVGYLSPRRGAGRKEMAAAIDLKVGYFCRFPWQLGDISYVELLELDRLDWKPVERQPTVGRKEFAVTRLLQKTAVESGSDPSTMTGSITFRTEPYWAVEELDLTYATKNPGEPVYGRRGALTYRAADNGETILDSVKWELTQPEGISHRYFMKVEEMTFGAVHPDDFTLAGCGIKTIDTSGSSGQSSVKPRQNR